MFISLKGRQTGKTTELIWDSYCTGFPIIVTTEKRKRYVEYMAECLNMKIKVYTVNELKEKRTKEIIDRVLIDELEDVVEYLLGAKIEKATISAGR